MQIGMEWYDEISENIAAAEAIKIWFINFSWRYLKGKLEAVSPFYIFFLRQKSASMAPFSSPLLSYAQFLLTQAQRAGWRLRAWTSSRKFYLRLQHSLIAVDWSSFSSSWNNFFNWKTFQRNCIMPFANENKFNGQREISFVDE